MIITRTPFRVSFAGGGSDLKEFYARNSYGAVVSSAINRYMYIVIHPYFHDKIRLKYSKTEDVAEVGEIEHPIFRECLKKVNIDRGVEITSFADIPSGTGLGSSSSFTVGLLNALYAYKGRVVSKEMLAREACEIEIDILREPIGKQDQYAAAYGNINYIRFNRDETVDVMPIMLTPDAKRTMENNLSLYHVGGKRRSGDILHEQRSNIASTSTMENLIEMVNLAENLKDSLSNNDISAIGNILHKGWMYKKGLAAKISNNDIDELYDSAMKQGAKGGKLLGAGGTGFLLLYSSDHQALKERLQRKVLPFSIDHEGTKILYYE